jgi:hypothetical protein
MISPLQEISDRIHFEYLRSLRNLRTHHIYSQFYFRALPVVRPRDSVRAQCGKMYKLAPTSYLWIAVTARVPPPSFLVENGPAPQRAGETLQFSSETLQSVAIRGRDAAAPSKAACRLPSSFRPMRRFVQIPDASHNDVLAVARSTVFADMVAPREKRSVCGLVAPGHALIGEVYGEPNGRLVFRCPHYAVATASWNQEIVTWAKIAFAFSLDP